LPVFGGYNLDTEPMEVVNNHLAEMLFEEQEDGQFTRQESSTTLQDSTDSVPNPVEQPEITDDL